MSSKFIRSRLISDRTSATEVLPTDLPTNPISHLIVTLCGYNVTDEATLAEILAFLNTLTVSKLGVTVANVQSEDLYALNCYLYGKRPILTSRIATDNQHRQLSFIVPFGRTICDPDECFPATQKGELTLTMDLTVLGTSVDNGLVNVDVVQLPDAKPTHYIKCVTKTEAAPGAVGDHEVVLPLGNEIVMIQLRETTFPGASSHVYGVEQAAVLVDEQEYGYSAAGAENLVGDMGLRVDGQSGDIAASGLVLPYCTVWLDFDPRGDGQYLLDTRDKKSVKMRLYMGVNEATNITVVERVAVS
jgi:hypothetical protein